MIDSDKGVVMASDKIIFYDDEFMKNFMKLKDMIEAGNHQALYTFLLEHFGYIFRIFQYYAKDIADGNAKDFEEADEMIKRELMRPLSYRQYRLVEGSFSKWKNEEELVIWSIWDFLHDNGRIFEKEAMSSAEVCACSMILENVYVCLSRLVGNNSKRHGTDPEDRK